MGGKFKQKKGVSKTTTTSRKDLRKHLRKEKKAKKNAYHRNKNKDITKNKPDSGVKKGKQVEHTQNKVPNFSSKTSEKKSGSHIIKKGIPHNIQTHSTFLDEQNKVHKQEIKEKEKLDKGIKKMRKKVLKEANKVEDKEIKKLEKQLKLNKRKSKSIPKSFAEEGLDYLLEVCNTDKFKETASTEMGLHESKLEFEDDFALATGKKKRKLKSNNDDNNKKKMKKESLLTQELNDGSSLSSEDENMSVNSYDNDRQDHSNSSEENSEDDTCENIDSENESEDDLKDNESDKSYETDDHSEESDDGLESKDNEMGSDEEENKEIEDTLNEESSNTPDTEKNNNGTWEDIYGRLRDKKGNIVHTQDKGKYLPPHLRAQKMAHNEVNREELLRLKKQLKGLVNRLAESNMHSISNQLDELYMRNSRNDMNDSLLSLITEALIGRVLTSERLVMEHAMLIAILHANVGMEVGAHFLEYFVQTFNTMFVEGQDVANKELDNILLILSHLYNFKVFHSLLMFNILDLLSERFTEKEVELILLVLRSVGFSLRKDNPMALKDLVLRLQKKANESTHLKDNSRVRFMLDILLAVKNNNMTKIPQYDPSHSEHLKKTLKSLVHKGKYVTELKVTLEDLLKADERGRWWIVGSAWSGAPTPATPLGAQPRLLAQDSQFSQAVLEMARKQRMNTDNRRNIFCILMSAEDYLDAFEKLLRLGLKAQQEQEIVHVMMHCLLQEKTFNLYYAHLATHFCQADRKHQMTIQYHLWDKLKELSNLSRTQISNLAKLLAHLFLEKALPISVLKVMQFSEMDKACVRLLRQVLLSVLLSDNTESLVAVFSRVSRPERLHMFRESLRLFMHHFLLRNVSDLPQDQAVLLKERVKLAETALVCEDISRKYL